MRVLVCTLVCLTLQPVDARAWGFEAHKFIADRMIALLPPELRTFFDSRRAFVVERSVDPDLWRTVGWDAEPPNHFVDLDFFGKFPFAELPRDYDRAVEKYGREVVHQQGLLPWRTQEFYGRLRREFEALARPNQGFAVDNIPLFATVLGHYVGDAHVPLHAVVNYDGQLSGQRGIHSRWEAELFERNRGRLTIDPAPVKPVADVRAFMFETLLASFQLADDVLAADKKAAAGREFYDDAYFEALAKAQLGVVERRLSESITAVASVIVAAWQEAGRPTIPATRVRPPRRISPR